MRSYQCFFCALCLWLAVPVIAQSKDKDETVAQTTALLQSLSQVRDAAALNFAALSRKPTATWVVAQINPGPFSGGGRSGSSYIEADSGKLVQVPGGHDVIRLQGTFHVIAALTGRLQNTDYTYQWDFPLNTFRPSKNNPVELFGIFINGGTAIFPLPKDLQNATQLLPIYSVPAEWQTFVSPAWQYYEANAALFEPQRAIGNQEKLLQLLEGENPILAIHACRTLANAELLDLDFIHGPLLRAAQLRQAVFTFLLLAQSLQQEETKFSNADLVAALQQTISDADAEKLPGVALGSLAGLRQLNYGGDVRAFRALEALEKKPTPQGGFTESTLLIARVVKMASLPLLRQNPIYQGTDQPTKIN